MTDRFHDDATAWEYLASKGFTHNRGIIKPPITDLDHRHDQTALAAIDYLCDEWDWGYEP